jgi:hypothetical protein
MEQVRYVMSLTKNALGNILGDFFANSSGHPELKAHERRTDSDALEKLFFFSLVLYFSEGKQK